MLFEPTPLSFNLPKIEPTQGYYLSLFNVAISFQTTLTPNPDKFYKYGQA